MKARKPESLIVNTPKPAPKPGPGRPVKFFKFDLEAEIPKSEVNDFKRQVIEQLGNGLASTPTEAADLIGLQAIQVRKWLKEDKSFSEACRMAREVLGERLLSELRLSKNDIAKFFLIKGIFPEYRDNYKPNMIDSKLESLLKQLNALAKPKPSITVEPVQQTSALELPKGETNGVSKG